MKALISVLLLVSSLAFACPPAQQEACESQKRLRWEMDLISSNIAHLNTTRLPEGGPYQRQFLRCNEGRCEVATEKGVHLKYEPNHPDANTEGYVSYPAIDLMKEMTDMLSASKKYDEAAVICLGGRAAP